MPPKSNVDKDQLIELYVNQKKSGRETASIMNIPKSTVMAQIKKYGLSRTNREATNKDQYGRFVKLDQTLPPPNQNGKNNPYWKDGISESYYKRIAFEHFGKFCKICGTKENIEIHHIDKNRKNNTLKNLLPVCGSCHCKIDNRIFNINKMRKTNS